MERESVSKQVLVERESVPLRNVQTGRPVQTQPAIHHLVDAIRFTGGRIRRIKNPIPLPPRRSFPRDRKRTRLLGRSKTYGNRETCIYLRLSAFIRGPNWF